MAVVSSTDVSRPSSPAGGPSKSEPSSTRAFEKALTLAAMGFQEDATRALRQLVAREPANAPAWQKLAELLRLAGKDEEADRAASHAASLETLAPTTRVLSSTEEIEAAEKALRGRMREIGAIPECMKTLRDLLRQDETNVAAMRLLGRVEWGRGGLRTAQDLFERAVALAPEYEGARADLATLLQALREDTRAMVEIRRLLGHAPQNVTYRAMYADALRALGDLASALPVLEQLVRDEPDQVRFRSVYAQALRVAGRREESAQEFRACLALKPGLGEAYWGLAELRGKFLSAADITAMREHLQDSGLDETSRMLMQNALGQALEREGNFSASFAAYEAGAALAQAITAGTGESYDPVSDSDQMSRRRAVFTAQFFAAHVPATGTSEKSTPIFVLGMPRAGSTLVEQILASHSLVEGTMELPILGNIVRDLSNSRLLVTPDAYPECVSDMSAPDLAKLGARYLEESTAYRRTESPCFVDKRPWNWLEAGLIRLILPQAKIIDVRRAPMAACFAIFKHMLASDTAYPYNLRDLAHHYTQYAQTMAHYDRAMPGHMHFVSYERLVADTDNEIRRLLEYCGLPFEEQCLRFWETDRAVATPSSEQVRRPIFRDALEQWRNFEPWLKPLKDALEVEETVAAAAPQPRGYEDALTLAAMGAHETAIDKLREVTEREPGHPGAWGKLAELLRLAGNDEEAEKAGAAAARSAGEAPKWQTTRDPRTPHQLQAAERNLQDQLSSRDRAGRMDMLRKHLTENPTDAAAMHMLAGLLKQNGEELPSFRLLERTVELSPLYHTARAELAVVLMGFSFWVLALEQSAILLRQMPRHPDYRVIHSEALKSVGDFAAAAAVTEELLQEFPRDPRVWYTYGEQLHCLGRRDDSARAFRTCLDIVPSMGEAWWRLADLKSGYLTEADIAAMRTQLADPALDSENRMYMNYALGAAQEHSKDFSGSFAAYQKGARLFRGSFLSRGEAYSEDTLVTGVQARKRVYTAHNLATRAAPPPDSPAITPIFVVGMPRAGSTLVEQILASHSQVEGTRELPVLGDITRDLMLSRILLTPRAYPDCVLEMDAAKLAGLGERYLREAQRYRKTGRPWFVDKRPWNWLEAGLIHLILPHAKIIDIRREPMAACFAMYKQVLPDADFSYDLRDLGRYYTEYAGLMDYWQSVMPGRIHFVAYERLVDDTENEVRRMLDYCGLPFEQGCLRFWETERAVTTPSAEQVRRPIFRSALEQWRNFEPWLGPLKAALAEPPRA